MLTAAFDVECRVAWHPCTAPAPGTSRSVSKCSWPVGRTWMPQSRSATLAKCWCLCLAFKVYHARKHPDCVKGEEYSGWIEGHQAGHFSYWNECLCGSTQKELKVMLWIPCRDASHASKCRGDISMELIPCNQSRVIPMQRPELCFATLWWY